MLIHFTLDSVSPKEEEGVILRLIILLSFFRENLKRDREREDDEEE